MKGFKIMFYKVLFLLACYNLYRSGKSFVKENVIVKDGKQAEISTGAYISFGISALFHVMVLAVSLLPTLLW